MGLFHDKWVVSWGMDTLTNKATIFPAIVLTYVGTGAPLLADIAATVRSQAASTSPGASGLNPPALEQLGAPYPSPNALRSDYPTPGEFGGGGSNLRIPAPGDSPSRYPPAGQFSGAGDNGLGDSDSSLSFNFSQVPALAAPAGTGAPSGANAASVAPLPPLELASKISADAPIADPGDVCFGHHATAPNGSMLYVRNVANAKLVRVMITHPVSEADKAEGITLRLSKMALDQLAPAGATFWVETEYEDVTLESRTITPNGDGIDDRLTFGNLRNGDWTLTVRNQATDKEYTTKGYKNDWGGNVPAGPYSYFLENKARGQAYRPYQGVIVVQN